MYMPLLNTFRILPESRREITAGLLMAIKQKNFPARMRSMKVKKLFIDVRKLHFYFQFENCYVLYNMFNYNQRTDRFWWLKLAIYTYYLRMKNIANLIWMF